MANAFAGELTLRWDAHTQSGDNAAELDSMYACDAAITTEHLRISALEEVPEFHRLKMAPPLLIREARVPYTLRIQLTIIYSA